MDKHRAMEIAVEIKDECKKHVAPKCKGCPFLHNAWCILDHATELHPADNEFIKYAREYLKKE